MRAKSLNLWACIATTAAFILTATAAPVLAESGEAEIASLPGVFPSVAIVWQVSTGLIAYGAWCDAPGTCTYFSGSQITLTENTQSLIGTPPTCALGACAIGFDVSPAQVSGQLIQADGLQVGSAVHHFDALHRAVVVGRGL